MKKWIWTMGVLGGLAGSTLQAQETKVAASPWPNQIGLQLVLVEDADDPGYAVYYSRDLTLSDRLFLQVEMEDFNNSSRWEADGWTYRTKSSIDALELEAGYLRRLTSPNQPWGIHVGPSIGVAFDDGSFSSRATEDGGGADPGEDDDETTDGRKPAKAAGESVVESGDIELDPGISLYAVLMADYAFANHVGVMAMFSYGYTFEQDGEYKYSAGDRRSESFTLDDDLFWNFAVGATYEF